MATQRTRTYLLSRFEAGDRPTDQDFADLFESIIFINNDGIHANGLGTDTTSIAGDLNIGGTLDLTGNFKMAAKLSVGDTSQTLNSAISAYNTTTHAVVFASGSLSDTMFEGVSQDTTSSIKLTETMAGGSTNTLIFGTAAGRTFIQNDGQEIIHMTSSGHFTNSPQVYISGSLGIGSGWDSGAATSEQLHIQALGEGNATMRLTSDGTANDSIIKLRQSNNTGMDLIYDGGIDKFQIKENSNKLPFQIEYGADTNTLYLDTAGNVGIGTNNPTTKLHVVASPTIGVSNLGNAHILLGSTSFGLGFDSNEIMFNGHDGNIGVISNHSLSFITNGSTRMTIVGGGNVGIGTSSPSQKLHLLNSADDTNLLVESSKTNGRAQIRFKNDAQEFVAGTNTGDNFIVFDATNTTTPFLIEAATPNNTLYVDSNSRVGIGTNSPNQKLDVAGGHIELDSGYGIGRLIGNATDEHIIYPFSTGLPTSFTHITPQGTIQSTAMSLQSDAGINFIETDSNVLVGHMNVNEKVFDWDGKINARFFYGDGSNITNLTGAQINGLIDNGANNRIITAVDADSLRGESDFTFDGTDVKLDGNLAIGKGTAGLFTPDAPLHIKHTGDSLGNSDLIHLSMNSGTAEGNISIKFSDDAAVATQHFKITFGEGNNDLKFHSDHTDNILYLEDGGNVGIGMNNPDEKLSVNGGNIELTSTGKIGFNVSDDIGSYTVIEDSGTTATAADQVAHYGLSRTDTAIEDPVVLSGYYGLEFATQGTKRVTINKNGKIGIGTDTPDQKLHIKDDTSDLFVILETDKTDGRAEVAFRNDAQQWNAGVTTTDKFIINNATAGAITFKIDPDAPADQMILQSDNIAIGTKITIQEGLRLQSLIGANPLTNDYDGVFDGETGTLRRHEIFFPSAAGSTDPGFIFHQTSTSTTNSSTINLCPGDDEGSQDYVAIHGYDEPEMIRLFTTGEAHFRHGLGVGELWNQTGASVSGNQIASGKIHVKSNADAGLILEADVDNATESHNAYIRFSQDGNGVTGYIGFVGDANKDPENNVATNIKGNAMYIGTDTDEPLHLVTNNTGRFTIDSTGKVIIGSSDNTSVASEYTLSLKDGGISIDSNSNADHGFIHQGGEGAGIGLLGNHARIGNNFMDLHVSDNGKVSVGNPSTATSMFNVQSAASNTDVISVFSANNGDRIIQLSEFSGGHGGFSILNGSGTEQVRVHTGDKNFFKNNTGFGGITAAAAPIHVNGGTIASTDIANAAVIIGTTTAGLGMDPNEIYFQGHEGSIGTIGSHNLGFRINSVNKMTLSSTYMTLNNSLLLNGTGRNFYMDDFDDGNQNSRIISRENAFMVFEGGFIVGNYSNGTFTGDSAITEKVMHTRQIRIGDPANNNYRRIFMSGGRMFFQQMSGTSWDANAPYIENNDAEGQIETFTGQHRNKPSSNISNYTDKKGYIVVSSGVYSNIPENRTKEEIDSNNTLVLTTPQIDEALPIVDLSTTANDKKVFGVIANIDDPDSSERHVVVQGGLNRHYEARVDDRLVINSLGEGAIMVSNYNGNLENGDYITTSPIPGVGMKQDDDLLHNYTVAKITQDCIFDGDEEIAHEGVNYKIQLVGCTYHCG